MIRRVLAATALFVFATAAAPAPDSAGALAAAKATLAALGRHDATGFAALVLPEAVFVAQDYAPDGTVKTRIVPVARLTTMIADTSHELSEQMFDPVVQIEGDIAHVWAPYTFDVDGKRSHCGIDSFALARIAGNWRVTGLVWTNDPASCARWGK